jgi:hypothetical protein
MKLKCECGANDFIQEVAYVAIEKVEIDEDNGNYNIISQDMIGVKNDPEHFNHFKCQKCDKEYTLAMKDGKKGFWVIQ